MILGHSNISVTLGIYKHVDEDSRREALDRLDQVLRMVPQAESDGPADTPVAVTAAVTQVDPCAREDQG